MSYRVWTLEAVDELGRKVDLRTGDVRPIGRAAPGPDGKPGPVLVAWWPRGRRCPLCGRHGHDRLTKHPRHVVRLRFVETTAERRAA